MAKVWDLVSILLYFSLRMQDYDSTSVQVAHTLQLQNGKSIVIQSDPWQGTIVYLKLKTDKEINPSDVVANRTNVAEQYNESFLNDKELEELW